MHWDLNINALHANVILENESDGIAPRFASCTRRRSNVCLPDDCLSGDCLFV